MSNLKEVVIVDLGNKHIGTVEKVSFTPNKANGEPDPKSYNVTMYNIEMAPDEKLPVVFHLESTYDDGILQKRFHLLNCQVTLDQGDACKVCLAKAPGV
jgi:hypothetical protein